MADHKWIPVDFMDEMQPAPRDAPEDWLGSLDDGAPCLTCDEFDEVGPIGLVDGKVVAFSRYTDYGEANLTLSADGSWSVAFPMPPEAQQCCILQGWQLDTLGSSIEETVRLLVESGGGADDDYWIAYYTFSNPMPFKFDCASRSFVPADNPGA